jgi:hypothetical protein
MSLNHSALLPEIRAPCCSKLHRARVQPVRFDSWTCRRPTCITRRAHLRVGQRAARSLPERRPATPASAILMVPRAPTKSRNSLSTSGATAGLVASTNFVIARSCGAAWGMSGERVDVDGVWGRGRSAGARGALIAPTGSSPRFAFGCSCTRREYLLQHVGEIIEASRGNWSPPLTKQDPRGIGHSLRDCLASRWVDGSSRSRW